MIQELGWRNPTQITDRGKVHKTEETWRVNSYNFPLSVSSGQVTKHFLGDGHWPLNNLSSMRRDWLYSLQPITHSPHTSQPPTPRLALVRAGHRYTRSVKKVGPTISSHYTCISYIVLWQSFDIPLLICLHLLMVFRIFGRLVGKNWGWWRMQKKVL